MRNVRRYYVNEGIYFLTSVTRNRQPIFKNPVHVEMLFEIMKRVRNYYPHELQAFVILPDHFHFLIKPDDCSFSKIMHSLHRNFTNYYKTYYQINESISLWQNRFYDHVIRNDEDWRKHMDYIHYNPVKHGYAQKPELWTYSSYQDCVKKNWYEIGWGWSEISDLSKLELE